jgi:hypothetical protein
MLFSRRENTLKKATAPISLAGCHPGEVRHLGKFGGDTVIDIMRTHPMIIIGGLLHRNPFYVPPEEFLREVRQRRAMRPSPSSAAA